MSHFQQSADTPARHLAGARPLSLGDLFRGVCFALAFGFTIAMVLGVIA